MEKEEVTTTQKFHNWNVWKDGKKTNRYSIKPLTPSQALDFFNAEQVVGIAEQYIDVFGLKVNEIEGKIS